MVYNFVVFIWALLVGNSFAHTSGSGELSRDGTTWSVIGTSGDSAPVLDSEVVRDHNYFGNSLGNPTMKPTGTILSRGQFGTLKKN